MGTSEGLSPCPFCGGSGRLEFSEVRDKLYVTIGCVTSDCREYLLAQGQAWPFDDMLKHVDQWNRRPK